MGEPRERPILFSGPMIRAILEGRKTQTRRVVTSIAGKGRIRELHRSDTPGYDLAFRDSCGRWNDMRFADVAARSPFGVPGVRLWVRETWCFAHPEYHDQAEGVRRGDRPVRDEMPWWCHYAATDDVDEPKWSPSIHMPRWASRITLRVTSVRVERVQVISEADARAEGVEPAGGFMATSGHWQNYAADGPSLSSARESFTTLWDSINGKRPGAAWRDNPWVWAVGFEVERKA